MVPLPRRWGSIPQMRHHAETAAPRRRRVDHALGHGALHGDWVVRGLCYGWYIRVLVRLLRLVRLRPAPRKLHTCLELGQVLDLHGLFARFLEVEQPGRF